MYDFVVQSVGQLLLNSLHSELKTGKKVLLSSIDVYCSQEYFGPF